GRSRYHYASFALHLVTVHNLLPGGMAVKGDALEAVISANGRKLNRSVRDSPFLQCLLDGQSPLCQFLLGDIPNLFTKGVQPDFVRQFAPRLPPARGSLLSALRVVGELVVLAIQVIAGDLQFPGWRGGDVHRQVVEDGREDSLQLPAALLGKLYLQRVLIAIQ